MRQRIPMVMSIDVEPDGRLGKGSPSVADQVLIRTLSATVDKLRDRLEAIEESRWWRLRRRLLQLRSLLCFNLAHQRRGLLRRLLKALFGRGRQNLRGIARTVCGGLYLWLQDEPVMLLPAADTNLAATSAAYTRWLGLHAPRPADLAFYRNQLPLLRNRPTLSILLPVFDPPLDCFHQAVQSVLDQVYPDWELCIADDASSDPRVGKAIAEYSRQDPRIRVVYRTENGHIAAASNSALALATGEFCALLDHDDRLSPDALFQNVVALNCQPDLDLLYSDEDKIDERGRRCEPHFKPDWCPDTLLSSNYLSHLLVARTELIYQVGGFREGFEGAQDYDLVLRLTEQTRRIHHIPQVLYHWRKHAQSAAQSRQAKPYAYQAGQRALEEALTRRGESGTVEQVVGASGYYTVRYALPADDRVGILIPTRDQAPTLETCLRSLFERTRHQAFQVVVVDNGSREPQTHELLARYAARYPGRFAVLRDNGGFNFSRLVNAGAGANHDPYLLLLNNDVAVLDGDWLEAMLEQARRPSIGCVGARLLYPDGSVQHAGVVVRGPSHAFRHADRDAAGYQNRLRSVSNYSAVTAACLLVRRAVFDQVGGFDEAFAVDYNDVDFCLRVRQAGYHNLIVPHATLLHHELLSRKSIHASDAATRRHTEESKRFHERWPDHESTDPCISPHLDTLGGDLRLVA